MSTATLGTHARLLVTPSIPGSPNDLPTHHSVYGPLPIPSARDRSWSDGIFRAVAESGLLGRGGAGFPAVVKWDAIRRATRAPHVARTARRPLLVVNAMEGEPASAKDRVLLVHAPHLVLDGAEVVATVIGAREIVVCVADDSRTAVGAVESAIAERARSQKPGMRISVRQPPARYMAGEESALVNWLATDRSLPFLRTDKSVPLSVGRRPTLVHNAETLAQVALIARHGPGWFRGVGTAEAPGTTLVTVTGAVRSPGVIEVELGTPIRDMLARVGTDSELSGVLVGGYGGGWVDGSFLSVPYAPGPLAVAGVTHGVGVLVALPSTSCGIAETARIVRYMAGESSGQCGPCVYGLPAIAGDLEQLWTGRADADVLDRILRRSAEVDGRGACRHPDGVARLVRSALAVFAADAHAHAHGRPCPGHAAPTVLTLPGRPTVPSGAQ